MQNPFQMYQMYQKHKISQKKMYQNLLNLLKFGALQMISKLSKYKEHKVVLPPKNRFWLESEKLNKSVLVRFFVMILLKLEFSILLCTIQ